MGQRTNENDAALKGAQIMLKKEEYARSMGQKLNPNDAAVMDAQVKPSKEEHAKDTVHAATPTDESTAFSSYLKRLSSVVLLQTIIKKDPK